MSDTHFADLKWLLDAMKQREQADGEFSRGGPRFRRGPPGTNYRD